MWLLQYGKTWSNLCFTIAIRLSSSCLPILSSIITKFTNIPPEIMQTLDLELDKSRKFWQKRQGVEVKVAKNNGISLSPRFNDSHENILSRVVH